MRPFHIDSYKTTIWWSAKSGCSTIKNMIHTYILKENTYQVHDGTWNLDCNKLQYRNILIVRNPIMRCISCYLEKYKWWKEMWFSNADYTFVDFLHVLETRFQQVEEHHFARQFEEEFSNVEFLYMKQHGKRFRFDKVLALETLDFKTFLQEFFQIELDHIPLLHVSQKANDYFVPNAMHIPKPQLINEQGKLPNYHSFLSDEMIAKIRSIYKKDYFYLEKYDILYD